MTFTVPFIISQVVVVVAYGAKRIGTKFLRVLNITASIFYIIYAICIHSWLMVPCETYVIMTTIIGWVRHENKLSNTI